MEDEDRYLRVTLRIPKDLHARLAAEAERTSKSQNAEIIARLEQSFAMQQEASNAALLLEMRRTQVHLELNRIQAAMGALFARGQEIRAAIARMEEEKADPQKLEAAHKAMAAIPREKKALDVREAKLLGELHALDARQHGKGGGVRGGD